MVGNIVAVTKLFVAPDIEALGGSVPRGDDPVKVVCGLRVDDCCLALEQCLHDAVDSTLR